MTRGEMSLPVASVEATSCMKKKSRREAKRRYVSWGGVTLYEFGNTLGDHPCCEGASLTLEWKHDSKRVLAIEFFEYLRHTTYPRRTRKDLVVSSTARATHLLGLGYKLEELMDAAEESRKIRKSRQATMLKGKAWDKFKKVFVAARSIRTSIAPEQKTVAAKTG